MNYQIRKCISITCEQNAAINKIKISEINKRGFTIPESELVREMLAFYIQDYSTKNLEYTDNSAVADVHSVTDVNDSTDVHSMTDVNDSTDVHSMTDVNDSTDVHSMTDVHGMTDVNDSTDVHGMTDVNDSTDVHGMTDVNDSTDVHSMTDIDDGTNAHSMIDVDDGTNINNMVDVVENDVIKVRPRGTLRSYLRRAILKCEHIENGVVAKMFGTTNNAVSVTKSRVKKDMRENMRMIDLAGAA